MAEPRKPKVSAWMKLRIRLGMWMMGGEFSGVVALYQLIADRARECVTPNGEVILAKAQPLADVLYAQTPGDWHLTLTRTLPSEASHG